MKHNKNNGGWSQPPGWNQMLIASKDKSFPFSGHSRQRPSGQIEMLPEMNAARAVFNTPELLEAILVNLTIESLARSLSVSKYCRRVILGSLELRRLMFLDPSPATEFIELDGRQILDHPNARRQTISQPNQNSLIVVKGHPLLISLRDNFAFRAHSCQKHPSGATHGIVDGTMPMASLSTLPFQPPPPRIRVFYRDQSFVLERDGGVTFGDIVEGLQDLRIRCQKTIDKLVKQPCTPGNRYWYADAMEALGGVPYSHWWCDSNREPHFPHSEPCVFLAAEGAISEDS